MLRTCVDFKRFEDQVSKWVIKNNFSFWNAYNTNYIMVDQMAKYMKITHNSDQP